MSSLPFADPFRRRPAAGLSLRTLAPPPVPLVPPLSERFAGRPAGSGVPLRNPAPLPPPEPVPLSEQFAGRRAGSGIPARPVPVPPPAASPTLPPPPATASAFRPGAALRPLPAESALVSARAPVQQPPSARVVQPVSPGGVRWSPAQSAAVVPPAQAPSLPQQSAVPTRTPLSQQFAGRSAGSGVLNRVPQTGPPPPSFSSQAALTPKPTVRPAAIGTPAYRAGAAIRSAAGLPGRAFNALPQGLKGSAATAGLQLGLSALSNPGSLIDAASRPLETARSIGGAIADIPSQALEAPGNVGQIARGLTNAEMRPAVVLGAAKIAQDLLGASAIGRIADNTQEYWTGRPRFEGADAGDRAVQIGGSPALLMRSAIQANRVRTPGTREHFYASPHVGSYPGDPESLMARAARLKSEQAPPPQSLSQQIEAASSGKSASELNALYDRLGVGVNNGSALPAAPTIPADTPRLLASSDGTGRVPEMANPFRADSAPLGRSTSIQAGGQDPIEQHLMRQLARTSAQLDRGVARQYYDDRAGKRVTGRFEPGEDVKAQHSQDLSNLLAYRQSRGEGDLTAAKAGQAKMAQQALSNPEMLKRLLLLETSRPTSEIDAAVAGEPEPGARPNPSNAAAILRRLSPQGSALVDPLNPAFKRSLSPTARIAQAQGLGLLDSPESPEAAAFVQGLRSIHSPEELRADHALNQSLTRPATNFGDALNQALTSGQESRRRAAPVLEQLLQSLLPSNGSLVPY